MTPQIKRQAVARGPSGGKPLRDDLAGFYGYRTGSLRIVYSIDKTKRTAQVVAIGPRRTVYQELEREMARHPSKR